MSSHIVFPNSQVEATCLDLQHYRPGTEVTILLEVVVDADHDEARLAYQEDPHAEALPAGSLLVSDDAGGTWNALGTDVQAGYQLGPMTKADRKALLLKVAVSAGSPMRSRAIVLLIGEGT